MMMGWHDFSDWIAWGLLICAFLVVLPVAITYLQRCCCFGRRKAPPLFIEELLESIQDVAYQELPDAAGAGAGDDRDSCVICITPYEAGEACSVLPGCTHMFHKPCVARWLRRKNTCPLCRATVGVPAHPHPPPRQPNLVNAAENAV